MQNVNFSSCCISATLCTNGYYPWCYNFYKNIFGRLKQLEISHLFSQYQI